MTRRSLIFVLITLSGCVSFADGHLTWTPIAPHAKSEVDFWTASSRGCSCPHNPKNKSCACCAHEGACHCGPRVPNRCAQCGLQDQCDQMCNVTLDARKLLESSRLSFGQIKSLELRNNQVCWYRLMPVAGFRVELQLYRLIQVGHHNHSRCVNGYLEWVTIGTREAANTWRLCGANERYSPPVVFFSDSDSTPATLILKTDGNAERGRFLAYFSFTSIEHDTLGLHMRGENPLHGTDCDWMFRDTECLHRFNNSCKLSTPGFPGLYPPEKKCRYRIVLQSPFTWAHVQFLSVNLPAERCHSDNIRVSLNAAQPTVICQQNQLEFYSNDPEIVIEFNSGPLLPPYLYNGFSAAIHFLSEQPKQAEQRKPPMERLAHAICDYTIRSDVNVSSGFFSTSRTAWKVWPAPCTISFIAKPQERVLISLFNYNLTGEDCTSLMEIHDGALADVRSSSSQPRHKVCGPTFKSCRNSHGRFYQPVLLQSTHSNLTLRFRLDPTFGTEQYVEGAFLFHNHEKHGTLKAASLCDVDIARSSSASSGTIGNSFKSAIFWNVAGAVQCNATLFPRFDEAVTLTIEDLGTKDENKCVTQCDDSGCTCRVNQYFQLSEVDHVTVRLLDQREPLLCFCGNVKDILPVRFTSNAGFSVIQHIASYHFNNSDLKLKANYVFLDDYNTCGVQSLAAPSGTIVSVEQPLFPDAGASSYFYTTCLWSAKASYGQQLITTISTTQQGQCHKWNVTFYLYDERRPDHLGRNIDVICPDSDRTTFMMPSGIDSILIQLHAWGRQPAQFRLDWHSSHLMAATPDVQKSLSSMHSTSVTLTQLNVTSHGTVLLVNPFLLIVLVCLYLLPMLALG